jgi:hypothetical protein
MLSEDVSEQLHEQRLVGPERHLRSKGNMLGKKIVQPGLEKVTLDDHMIDLDLATVSVAARPAVKNIGGQKRRAKLEFKQQDSSYIL